MIARVSPFREASLIRLSGAQPLNEELESLNVEARELEERISEDVATLLEGK